MDNGNKFRNSVIIAKVAAGEVEADLLHGMMAKVVDVNIDNHDIIRRHVIVTKKIFINFQACTIWTHNSLLVASPPAIQK